MLHTGDGDLSLWIVPVDAGGLDEEFSSTFDGYFPLLGDAIVIGDRGGDIPVKLGFGYLMEKLEMVVFILHTGDGGGDCS